MIEATPAAAVAWQFAGRDPESREKVAVRIIAYPFFGLAIFITIDSVRSLLVGAEADHSRVGIALAAISLAVMPCCRMHSRAAASSGRCQLSPIRNRLSCAPTCRRYALSAWV